MRITKKQYWWLYGLVGSLLLGTGFSLGAEASHWKHQDAPFWQWILGGVSGIAMLLSGIVFLIRASIVYQKLKKK